MVVLEKTLESPLNCREIQPVHPKGDQFWVFIGRTDVEAEIPIFWPSDAKNWFIWKDPDVGKDWMQEEKGMTEGEMIGLHHWLDEHEFEWTPGVGDGQSVLQSTGSQRVGHDWATELNWTESTACSWWEGFESSSLATLPLGFNCSFISTSACESSTRVWSWGYPGGLGIAPIRAGCGGGTASLVAGVLSAPGI